MPNILESIRTAETTRNRDRLSSYVRLVGDVADGQDVAPADATSILQAAGKSAADLESDVAALQVTRETTRQLERLPAVLEEIARLEAEGRADIEQHEEAIRQFQARANQRQWDYMQLTAERENLQGKRAKRSLRGIELAAELDA